MKIKYQEYEVSIFDDLAYDFFSGENENKYDLELTDAGAELGVFTAKHGIKVFKEEQEVSSLIILGTAEETKIHDESAIISNDNLIILVSNHVYCMKLPQLEDSWSFSQHTQTAFKSIKQGGDQNQIVITNALGNSITINAETGKVLKH